MLISYMFGDRPIKFLPIQAVLPYGLKGHLGIEGKLTTPLNNKVHPFLIRVKKFCQFISLNKIRNRYMETIRQSLRQILAANIKEQRQIFGISQEKLAEMAGLSWQTVNSIECKRTWVSDNTLEALAKVFKVETFQLLMPTETRVALSLNSTEALRKLAEAKKAYDDTFDGIYSKIT